MSEPVKSTRTYDVSRRRAAAEQTRRAVLLAARDLFAEGGYAGTGVQEVAARAGVSVDTVYTSVGRKAHLLLAVHDMVLAESDEPLPAEQRDYVRAVREAPTGEAKIRTYAAALARVLPRSVPLLEALREAGATETECAAQYRAISDRRAANMRLLVADLRATGHMREDLSDEDAADLVWSLNSPEWYRLVTQRGRSPQEYAALLADVLQHTLLRPSPSA